MNECFRISVYHASGIQDYADFNLRTTVPRGIITILKSWNSENPGYGKTNFRIRNHEIPSSRILEYWASGITSFRIRNAGKQASGSGISSNFGVPKSRNNKLPDPESWNFQFSFTWIPNIFQFILFCFILYFFI